MNKKIIGLFAIPNCITFLRILLIPLFLIYSYRGLAVDLSIASISIALFIFLLIRLTDILDGWIARLTNSTSVLGAHLDVWADFLFVVCSYILFNLLNIIPLWLTLLVIYKFFEFLILSGIVKRHFLANNINNNIVIHYDIPGRIISSLFYLFPCIVLIFRLCGSDFYLLDVICYGLLLFTVISSVWKYFIVRNILKNN